MVNVLPPPCSPDEDFTIELDKTKLLLKPSRPYHMNQEECAECQRLLNKGLESGLMEPADPKCLITVPHVLHMEKGWNLTTSYRLLEAE